jgi:hypothetical protein
VEVRIPLGRREEEGLSSGKVYREDDCQARVKEERIQERRSTRSLFGYLMARWPYMVGGAGMAGRKQRQTATQAEQHLAKKPELCLAGVVSQEWMGKQRPDTM